MNERSDSHANAPAASRAGFCAYLKQRRQAQAISIDDIARITRIPARSLEQLEAGAFEELPADVFIRGFLRSYARCVGIDAEATVQRYAQCGLSPAPVASPQAQALLEAMARLAPEHAVAASRIGGSTPSPRPADTESDACFAHGSTAALAIPPVPSEDAAPSAALPEHHSSEHLESATGQAAAAPVIVTNQAAKRGRGRRRKKRHARGSSAPRRDGGAPRHDSCSELAADVAPAGVSAVKATQLSPAEPAGAPPLSPAGASAVKATPRSPAPVVLPRPTLLIDDANPDVAERAQVERAAVPERDASTRMSMPAALLDADAGPRRGALTLAVIILVIVATITMSYLMRRPSYTGDGITQLDPGTPAVGSR